MFRSYKNNHETPCHVKSRLVSVTQIKPNVFFICSIHWPRWRSVPIISEHPIPMTFHASKNRPLPYEQSNSVPQPPHLNKHCPRVHAGCPRRGAIGRRLDGWTAKLVAKVEDQFSPGGLGILREGLDGSWINRVSGAVRRFFST